MAVFAGACTESGQPYGHDDREHKGGARRHGVILLFSASSAAWRTLGPLRRRRDASLLGARKLAEFQMSFVIIRRYPNRVLKVSLRFSDPGQGGERCAKVVMRRGENAILIEMRG